MKTLIYLTAGAIAAFPALAPAQNADSIIDRAAAAYARLNTMRAEFSQTLTNPLTGRTQTTKGVIIRRKPNLLSIDFDSGDRVTADGSTLWVYLPSSVPGQVVRMPYNGESASAVDPADQFLNSPRRRFKVSASGTAVLEGHPTHAVTLVPRSADAPFKTAKVWIDDSDSSIRGFDVESANGLRRHVVITSFTPNPPLSRSSFRFAVPNGAKVVDQKALAGAVY
ncbi:MAG: LolA family protein [Gemmatimonadaceae bacterium]